MINFLRNLFKKKYEKVTSADGGWLDPKTNKKQIPEWTMPCEHCENGYFLSFLENVPTRCSFCNGMGD